MATALRIGSELPYQAGLAHAGGADEGEARTSAVTQRRPDLRKFTAAADERPGAGDTGAYGRKRACGE